MRRGEHRYLASKFVFVLWVNMDLAFSTFASLSHSATTRELRLTNSPPPFHTPS